MSNLLMEEHYHVVKSSAESSCFTLFPVFFRLWAPSEETLISSNQPLTVSNTDDDDDEKTKDTCVLTDDDEEEHDEGKEEERVVSVQQVAEGEAHTEDARDPPPPVAEACMMAVCRCCEKQISRNWRFCAHCGMYLENTTTTKASVLVCDDNDEQVDTTRYKNKIVMDAQKFQEYATLAIVEDEDDSAKNEMSPEDDDEDYDLKEFERLQRSFNVQEMNLSCILRTRISEDDEEEDDKSLSRKERIFREKIGLADMIAEDEVNPHNDDFMEIPQDDSFDMVQEDLLDELG